MREILKLFSKTTEAVLTTFRTYRWTASVELKVDVYEQSVTKPMYAVILVFGQPDVFPKRVVRV